MPTKTNQPLTNTIITKLSEYHPIILHDQQTFIIGGIYFYITPTHIITHTPHTTFPIDNKLYENIADHINQHAQLQITIIKILTEMGHNVHFNGKPLYCGATSFVLYPKETILTSYPHTHQFHLSDPEVFSQLSNYIKTNR